jgi:hypothetical protein
MQHFNVRILLSVKISVLKVIEDLPNVFQCRGSICIFDDDLCEPL